MLKVYETVLDNISKKGTLKVTIEVLQLDLMSVKSGEMFY